MTKRIKSPTADQFHDECRNICGELRDVLDKLEDLSNRGTPGQRAFLLSHSVNISEACDDLGDATVSMEFREKRR